MRCETNLSREVSKFQLQRHFAVHFAVKPRHTMDAVDLTVWRNIAIVALIIVALQFLGCESHDFNRPG